MNDWEIRKCLNTCLVLLMVTLALVGLSDLGFEIPILRQIVAFVLLTFIPGILVLRIFKLHNLGHVKTLLYSVGLSIALLMFTGAIINSLYPAIGISNPMSDVPVMGAISILVLILSLFAYFRDKDFSNPNSLHFAKISLPTVYFLCLVLLLSILSALLMNFYNNNTLQLILIAILALIPIVIGFTGFIPRNLYPFALFVIAVSLLYHSSLASEYLVEWADNTFEYWISNSTVMNSEWDPTSYHTYNSALSLTIWGPIYSVISGIEMTWVFKAIYPLFYALVPVGMYYLLQKQTNDKIAFLSCFFFMSMFLFFDGMLGLHRQQIAELFAILIIIVLIDKSIHKTKRAFLLTIFGFSLILSHYALSYIFLFTLTAGLIMLWLVDIPAIRNRIYGPHSRFYGRGYDTLDPHANSRSLYSQWGRPIELNYVVLLWALAILWYTLVASSAAFDEFVVEGEKIINNFRSEFLDTESTQGLQRVVSEPETILSYIYKSLHLGTLGLIVIGFSRVLLGSKMGQLKFNAGYLALSIVFFFMAIGGVLIPYFASTINTSRMYHISLLLLSPFCVIGGMVVFEQLRRLSKVPPLVKDKGALAAISVLFAIYLLFNSGFVYELANKPSLFSLDTTDSTRKTFNEEEIVSVEWLRSNADAIDEVVADARDAFLLQMLLGVYSPLRGDEEIMNDIDIYRIFFTGQEFEVNGDVWLTDPNKGRVYIDEVELQDLTYRGEPFTERLFTMNKIYDTGNVAIRYR